MYNDVRAGTDREISACRIAPDGTMLWGANGVQLSDDTVDEFDSRICETSDGHFTVVYARSTTIQGLVMHRLDAAGTRLLAAEGVLIAGSGVGGAGASDGPAFFQMIPADNGSVICFYGKDTRTFSSPRHPTIQKYGPTGTGLWNGGNAIVLQASAWPIAYYPNLVSDGAGGAVVSWHDSRTGNLGVWVQRLDAAGNALFAAGGAAGSINNTGPVRLHVSPTAPVLGSSGEVYVFWSERDGGQGTRALYGQRFDGAGARQWGDGGIELTAFDTTIEDFMRAAPAPCGPGAIVIFTSEPTGGTLNDTMQALRVDGAGAQVWAGSPISVSTAASDKGRMPHAALRDGSVAIVWSDNRADGGDIYAMKVNTDGTLGGPILCPADFTRSAGVTVADIFAFLTAWFGADPCADFNRAGGITVQDIFAFLTAWFAPCP